MSPQANADFLISQQHQENLLREVAQNCGDTH